MTCASCGAGLRPGMTWCGQCFAPTEAPAPGVPAPPPAAPVQLYSRWQGGPTSFGPVGRVLLTLLLLAFEYWLYRFNLLGFAITTVLVVPLVLRDVWKRSAVQKRV